MYIGEQTVVAEKMSLGAYNTYRGWSRPVDEDGESMGYLIEYIGEASNHPKHLCRIAWIPESQLRGQFRSSGEWTFSDALIAIKSGLLLSRSGWNGRGMFVYLVPGSKFFTNRPPLLPMLGSEVEVTYRPHIDLFAADGTCGVWQPSMGDVMASDWGLADELR